MTIIQQLQLPENYDPPHLFCPACGAPIFGEGDSRVCPHLVIAIDPTGLENAVIGKKYKEIFEEIHETDNFDGDLIEAFLDVNDKESFLKFNVKFCGMSHSMEKYYISAVFDFAP